MTDFRFEEDAKCITFRIAELDSIQRIKWYDNPNSFGAYSHTASETKMSHFNNLTEEVDGNTNVICVVDQILSRLKDESTYR